MARLIQAHPDIDGVFGANDAVAAGIIEVLLEGRAAPILDPLDK